MGRRGRIRVKGGLPLTVDSSPAEVAAQLSAAAVQDGETKAAGKESAPAALLVDVQGLEMRVRNVYTGAVLVPSPTSIYASPVVCCHRGGMVTCVVPPQSKCLL